jgi:hypothetical protein
MFKLTLRALRLSFALLLALHLAHGLAPQTVAASPLIYPVPAKPGRPAHRWDTGQYRALYGGVIGSRDRTQVYDAYRAAYDYTR